MLHASLVGFSEVYNSKLYGLTAIVCFLGGNNVDHCITYRAIREPPGLWIAWWAKCSYSAVTPVREDYVLRLNRTCVLLQYDTNDEG
jgi:hypothetical protein